VEYISIRASRSLVPSAVMSPVATSSPPVSVPRMRHGEDVHDDAQA
jgi:hypothetical protein